jgi:peptidoglycan-N-acetylglucosamine deacetylase
MTFAGNKQAAVSFTYDDALDVHLDYAMPDLEAHGFRGTFFIPTRVPGLKAWAQRPGDWKAAAQRGHEIANHSQLHPCSNKESWVDPKRAVELYDLAKIEAELRAADDDIAAVVGTRGPRTYAYPCGIDWVGEERISYRPVADRLFVASRTGGGKLMDPATCEFASIPSFSLSQRHRIEEATEFVDRAIDEGKWAVFIFHGVGGGHSLYINRDFHRQLLAYVAERMDRIACGTFIEIVRQIRAATGRPWKAA